MASQLSKILAVYTDPNHVEYQMDKAIGALHVAIDPVHGLDREFIADTVTYYDGLPYTVSHLVLGNLTAANQRAVTLNMRSFLTNLRSLEPFRTLPIYVYIDCRLSLMIPSGSFQNVRNQSSSHSQWNLYNMYSVHSFIISLCTVQNATCINKETYVE